MAWIQTWFRSKAKLSFRVFSHTAHQCGCENWKTRISSLPFNAGVFRLQQQLCGPRSRCECVDADALVIVWNSANSIWELVFFATNNVMHTHTAITAFMKKNERSLYNHWMTFKMKKKTCKILPYAQCTCNAHAYERSLAVAHKAKSVQSLAIVKRSTELMTGKSSSTVPPVVA